MGLDEVLDAYAKLGFREFEVFMSWVKSAFDPEGDPEFYLAKARQYGLRFCSMHLPPVDDDVAASVAAAVRVARFAAAIGAEIVLYKATSRANYIAGAKPFLDAIADTGLTAVLQNHFGTPISDLDDFREVIDGIADARMKTLLEVGHFHSAGVLWPDACELLGDSIALVHIKDQVGRQSVPFGAGEIDLAGLFRHLDSVGYAGKFVIEMEVADPENTLEYLASALEYVRDCGLETDNE